MTQETNFETFMQIDIRTGTIVEAEVFAEARKPAYKMMIDFGADIGVKKSSAQITGHYTPGDLIGKQVAAVVNFPSRQIGPIKSEVLTLGFQTGTEKLFCSARILKRPTGRDWPDMTIAPCQIYLLTPPSIDDVEQFAKAFEAAVSAAPVACLQIRLKDTPKDKIIEITNRLKPIAHEHNCLLIMNDDPELAAQCDADGVHLGQSDMKINLAKQLISEDAIVGVTCHNSKELAFEAAMAGADYVAFGSFFKSETKPDASPADLELLSWWYEAVEIPSVAIGGITVDNAHEIISAGADFIAVSAGVWEHPDGPAQAVTRLSALCSQYSPQAH